MAPSAEPAAKALDRGATVVFYLFACSFFVYLLRYYFTGAGGPTLLTVTLVPATFILFTLDAIRTGDLYPKLGRGVNYLIATAYISLSVLVAVYLNVEFIAVRTVRLGIWNQNDLLVGGIMFLLVMEYCRTKYFALFVINLILLLYTVYGWLVPGLFGHPGLTWTRVITAMSVEMSTGVFSQLPQLALTLIGSFMLVLSLLQAFGCIDSLLKIASKIAGLSPQALPQAAVLGSMSVAAVSGSSAANAITTGSATIPAMIGSGIPRVTAAAIETAASLGGQLMPPIMGIAAFLMAEFLGRSYFDVVSRGYAPALVYFAGITTAVYFIAAKHRGSAFQVEVPEIGVLDRVNLLAYLGVVVGLVYMMGVIYLPPTIAALRVFVWVGIILSSAVIAVSLFTELKLKIDELGKIFLSFVQGFARMTSDITLLLATLSIMTGAFVITGIPTKLGFLLMEAAGIHLTLMIVVAFCFGTLVGTGLPPAPTYIITVLVIAPFMIKAGVDPWSVHFFAFFVGVWGELTPPTSVVAAVTSKIADASFMGTMMKGILICLPLFVLMGAVFTRPELVVEPGLHQLFAFVLVLAGTMGLVSSVHATFSEKGFVDVPIRLALAILSIAAALVPNDIFAIAAALPVTMMVIYGFIRSRKMTRYGEAKAEQN
ncbi:MAG: TRAP transporter large permease subunit [Deltaproteobacteria bacterium]|nr:TRAP transporter large permease subunit [Deltaproteobacteria bacterium]